MLGQPVILSLDLSKPGVLLLCAKVNGRRFYGRTKPEVMNQIGYVPTSAGRSPSRRSH